MKKDFTLISIKFESFAIDEKILCDPFAFRSGISVIAFSYVLFFIYGKLWEMGVSSVLIPMELVDDGQESSNNDNEIEVTNSQLICGLPDDISLMCLARVPRKYHSVLKCVSKKWRDLICSEGWRSYRRKQKLDETWIYALCMDKLHETFCYVLDPTSRSYWKLIDGLPPHVSIRRGMGFETLGNKLFLLGGFGPCRDATDEVYSYNASLNCWVEAASMSSSRCNFACEVLDEKLYAIGGIVSNTSDHDNSWDTFDPLTNSWTSNSDPNIPKIPPDIEDSVVIDGKIYVRCGRYPTTPNDYGVVYEPSSGTWQYADADMVSGWNGPAVVVDGNLFVLDKNLGSRLMMWHKERREWMPVGKLSPLLTKSPCKLVAVGKSIFVVGKGLSTVVLDVSNFGTTVQVMMGFSLPRVACDFNVLSCKCFSLYDLLCPVLSYPKFTFFIIAHLALQSSLMMLQINHMPGDTLPNSQYALQAVDRAIELVENAR
ncbi:F-box/kelch-repeat protein SKIP4, partial [Mucuna pruriens]